MNLRNLFFGLTCLALAGSAFAQDIQIKGGDIVISALSFGQGDHVLLVLPGRRDVNGRSNKNVLRSISSDIAKQNAGVKVISISWSDFRDISAAVDYARESGAKKISLLGHSFGAQMAGRFASSQSDGDFDTLILLASTDDQGIPLTKTKKLFAFRKGDSIGKWTSYSFDKSVEPKQILALDGSGHNIQDLISARPSLVEDINATLNR